MLCTTSIADYCSGTAYYYSQYQQTCVILRLQWQARRCCTCFPSASITLCCVDDKDYIPIAAPNDPLATDNDADVIPTSVSATGGVKPTAGSGGTTKNNTVTLNPAFVRFPNPFTVDQSVMDFQCVSSAYASAAFNACLL
jgi:hypothetical protein